jgi:hypothetical protein
VHASTRSTPGKVRQQFLPVGSVILPKPNMRSFPKAKLLLNAILTGFLRD